MRLHDLGRGEGEQGRRGGTAILFFGLKVRDNAPMTISDALLDWFEGNARELPWRTEPRDAYRTLVSEIMLQQTQVDRVAPHFVEFVRRWPDLETLAVASEDDVLAIWSGLGYYRRARMLHKLAREVVESGSNQLPDDIEALTALPGIGDYTAAAVGSLAFGIEAPVLDGNVQRVVARVTAFGGDPRASGAQSWMKDWVRGLFLGQHPGVVNEALMELGATICTPSKARCEECPLAFECMGHKEGHPEEYPPPRKVRPTEDLRWVAACLVGSDERWLLRRVQEGPILRGLWLPPFADLQSEADPATEALALAPEGLPAETGAVFPAVRHHITHRRIEVIPVLINAPDADLSAALWQWARPGEVAGGTSSLFLKLHKVVCFNEKEYQNPR